MRKSTALLFSALCLAPFAQAQNTLAGNLTVQQTVKLTGAASPATITSNVNDYAPTGFATAAVLRLQSDVPRTITGLAGGVAGRMVWLTNVGTQTISLATESALSTAANRFAFGASGFDLPSGGSLSIWYDTTSSRWRAATNLAAGGGGTTIDQTARDAAAAAQATADSKQAALANAGTLAKVSESAGLPLWDGAAWPGGGSGGTGTVTSVSVVTANGVSGSVANASTTPAITLSLGAITPSSVAASGAVTGSNLSGTNTGDQTDITGNAGTATKLATARTINGVAFDGTANITVAAVDQAARDAAATAQTTANEAETPAGAQAKANAAQAAAIASAAGALSGHVVAADPHGDRAFAVQRANHTGTQAATTITTDATHRFVTDTEKSTWDAKQAALVNATTLAKITESAGLPIWDGGAWPGGGSGGTGTVTSVSVVSANGVSGSVANASTTPAITLSLGAITPSSVAASGSVTGSNLSGTNTGDQTSVAGNAGTATALQTARTINGVSFDGTANITVPAAAGTLTGSTLASGVTASSLTSAAGGTFGTAAFTAATAYDPAGAAAAITLAGLGGVPTTRTVNGHALSADVTVTAADLGATTLGQNLLTLTNPSAVTFPRFNADNTVTALSASDFRTAIGAGTSSFNGSYSSLSDVPTTFAPSAHNQAWSTITTTPTTLSGYGVTDAQPLDSDLTSIAALTTTAFGRGLLTQVDAAGTRTTIGAGTSSFDGAYASLSGIPSTFTPAAHNQAWSTITSKPTTLSGYGITDAQPLDTELTAISALANASGVLTNNGSGVLSWATAGGSTDTVIFETDFTSPVAGTTPGISLVLANGATVANFLVPSGNHPGVVSLLDSNTADASAAYVTSNDAFLLAGGEEITIIASFNGVRLGQKARIGFLDTSGVAYPTDGVFFEWAANGSVQNLTGWTATASTAGAGATDTSYTTTNETFYRLKIALNSNASVATFTIHSMAGSLLWTQTKTTGIPTGASRNTGAGVVVFETSVDNAAEILRLDYMKCTINRRLTR